MVSQDSPPNSPSNMLHQFIISDSTQNQFQNQQFDNVYMLPTIQSLGERMSRSMDLVHAPAVAEEPETSHTKHFIDLFEVANESSRQAQRLSLSLGSHMRSLNPDIVSPSYFVPGQEYNWFNRSCSNSYGAESLGSSRYLKAAQSLLEEIVNIGARQVHEMSNERYVHGGGLRLVSELKAEFCNNSIRISKLIALLEEVENRYEKYYNQMEQVVSSFEEIGGVGAAKSYTALALEAMSRHFGSLKDAILSQINAGRHGRLPKSKNRMSLQQLGMIPNKRQAWRPIRGLPETSVLILRSWLFEHFLHPYPNDSEKLMLASQTGLTKNQVSNWFINARVRLWKPMIEEMYKEEFGEDSSEDWNPLVGED